jgi:hypothetical protein
MTINNTTTENDRAIWGDGPFTYDELRVLRACQFVDVLSPRSEVWMPRKIISKLATQRIGTIIGHDAKRDKLKVRLTPQAWAIFCEMRS